MSESVASNQPQVQSLLQALPQGGFWPSLSVDCQAQLLQCAQIHGLEKNDVLFQPGQTAGQVHLFLQGKMYYEEAGPTRNISAGELLGLSNYLEQTPYRVQARALTDCRLLAWSHAALHKLEADSQELADAFHRELTQRIRRQGSQAPPRLGTMMQPVRDWMRRPLISCSAEDTLQQAYLKMRHRGIGSLVVMGAHGKLLGLLTCSGLSEALAVNGVGPQDRVAQAVCENVPTLSPDAPLWQAESLMETRRAKYLLVCDQQQPLGMISQTDLLRAMGQGVGLPLFLAERHDLDALREQFDELATLAYQAREQNRLPSRAVAILSEAHWRLQTRCIELTLADLPMPPRPFAILIMGSGGRHEMLLDPDQDNGMILDDGPPLSAKEKNWVSTFTEQMNHNLDQIGYILCPGDIMARNPRFCKTLRGWKEQFSHLIEHPNLKAARFSTIVFDFDTLYGESHLSEALREHLLSELHGNKKLLDYMVDDDAEGAPPLGLFNRWVLSEEPGHEHQIDLKRNGLRLIVDAARVYALSADVGQTSTRERLQRLINVGVMSVDLSESIQAAFEEILDCLLAHQIEQRRTQQSLDKYIDPQRLSSGRASALRNALRAVKRLQDQLQGQYGHGAF